MTGRRFVTKDGSFFMGVGIDITDRQELDRQMQELNRELAVKEQRFSRLMERTFDAIFTHSEGNIIQANDAARLLIGAKTIRTMSGTRSMNLSVKGPSRW